MPGKVARSWHIQHRQHQAEPPPATSSHLPCPSQGRGTLEVPQFRSGQWQIPNSEGSPEMWGHTAAGTSRPGGSKVRGPVPAGAAVRVPARP